ncbi:MAG: hypothetical protein HQM08_19015 [Candidatus Riflebacteria bacterium]|nr:hypothetical protein [Candidatus Riflebacteria bacterium]
MPKIQQLLQISRYFAMDQKFQADETFLLGRIERNSKFAAHRGRWPFEIGVQSI